MTSHSNTEFVPYELAFKLVYDLGFKEKCLATIDQVNDLHIKGTKSSPRGAMLYDIVDCPTFSQAFRWFREKYGLASQFAYYHVPKWTFEILEFTDIKMTPSKIVVEYSKPRTYEEAETACLEKLIEIIYQTK